MNVAPYTPQELYDMTMERGLRHSGSAKLMHALWRHEPVMVIATAFPTKHVFIANHMDVEL